MEPVKQTKWWQNKEIWASASFIFGLAFLTVAFWLMDPRIALIFLGSILCLVGINVSKEGNR